MDEYETVDLPQLNIPQKNIAPIEVEVPKRKFSKLKWMILGSLVLLLVLLLTMGFSFLLVKYLQKQEYEEILRTLTEMDQNKRQEVRIDVRSQLDQMSSNMSNALNEMKSNYSHQLDQLASEVTLTACEATDNHDYSSEIMKLTDVKVQIGINNLASYRSNGIFVCEKAGLYVVSATIISDAGSLKFSVRKNKSVIVQSFGTLKEGIFENAQITVALLLEVGDTIDIHADNNVYNVRKPGSCVTIFKVK